MIHQGVTNIQIFEYSFALYSYKFVIQKYSDIGSYCFSTTNILGYSLVSFLYEYIQENQARKLQDAQGERLTSLQANK